MKSIHILILALSYAPLISFSQSDSLAKAPELIYTFVEQNPQYRGGEAELFKLFKKHSLYPMPGPNDRILPARKVLIRFVVETDGSVSNVTVVRSANAELDAEAIRLTKLLSFVPGRQQGKAVRVYYNLPVAFL